jgi:dihydroflavonol-4-reductase
VTGDMRDEASMTAAMKGARYFFHVAADYRLWARDPGEIERNNLKGAQASMGAALTCGVEKVIYTSSVAALKPGDTAVDETSRNTAEGVVGAYKRSKLVAEREVERLIEKEKLPAVIVAPHRLRSARATSSRRRRGASLSKPRLGAFRPSSIPA